MVYIVFDLDGTLGRFTLLWPFITAIIDDNRKDPSWDAVYEEFVRRIAICEKGPTPLGIFRPGIFGVMKRVAKLKQAGICKGVLIYSNNGSHQLITFVRDVIERVIRYKLFDDIIHYYHPLRIVGASGVPSSQKTWHELHELLMLSRIHAPSSVLPRDVIFFDDQPHKDLMTNLDKNYIRVSEYMYVPQITAVVDLFSSILTQQSTCHPDLLKTVGFTGPVSVYVRRFRRPIEAETKDIRFTLDRGSYLMMKALSGFGPARSVKRTTRKNTP